MSWKGTPKKVAGDVIRSSEWNLFIDALDGLFEYVHVENTPQPIQVSKPSILLLLAEGTCTPDFPNALSVYLSSDGVIFEEVANSQWSIVDLVESRTLTVPVPKDFYVEWSAPYGFIKNAVMF